MFHIAQRGSTIRREVFGGIATFMAMSYILFVQPAVLSKAGMDGQAVFAATCIASAVSCFVMAILANYPIALAPGMGENFFFVYIAGVMGSWGLAGVEGWQMALALVAVGGAIILLLSLLAIRSHILSAIPDALKSGIAAGIGLFIAVVGFGMGNLVEPGGALLKLANLHGNVAAQLTLIGLAVTLALLSLRIRGAILIGILASTAIAMIWGHTTWRCPVAWPHSVGTTAGGMATGFVGLWQGLGTRHALELLTLGFIVFFMDLFDSVGTLVGVTKRAGLMQGNRLPRAERALAADAVGTVLGSVCGTSTITSYIESIVGVQLGARTGLAAIVTGLCLLAALFFGPLVNMVMGAFQANDVSKFPTIAPALIVVGAMMLRAIRDVDWDDATEYLPAFLTVVTMALAYSISAGIAAGFVSYALGKLVTLRVKECPLVVYIFAALFVVQYVIM